MALYSSTASPAGGILPSISLRSAAGNNSHSSLFTHSFASFSHHDHYASSSSSSTTFASLRVSADSTPKARFVARRKESISVRQLGRPLIDYMSLPASQYSVLDAERIERIDDDTFRCYVYRFKFFNFEVCPVLLVKVEEQPNGCCIKLLSCKLEGSPIVVAQNDKFDGMLIFLSLIVLHDEHE
ncbi:hypothetical protein LINGRAPRIM_LOCUS2153 [Linum grandiflorum]